MSLFKRQEQPKDEALEEEESKMMEMDFRQAELDRRLRWLQAQAELLASRVGR